MGRTVPTFRQLASETEAHWSKFRRALRREDRQHFDRLFRCIFPHAQAAMYQASDNPIETIFLCIAMEHEKRLDAIERALRQAGTLPHTVMEDSESLPFPPNDDPSPDEAESETPPID